MGWDRRKKPLVKGRIKWKWANDLGGQAQVIFLKGRSDNIIESREKMEGKKRQRRNDLRVW